MSIDKKNLVLVNLKCCFSSFENLYKNRKIIKIYDKCWYEKFENKTVYMIVRDPIERLKSFHADKFWKCENKTYQTCQKNMLKYVDNEKMLKGELEFSDTIDAIKRGYKDGHIKGQCESKRYLIEKYNFQIIFIHLEKKEEIEKFQHIFQIELPQINKDVNNLKSKICVSEEEEKFIKDYFKDDFNKFNYNNK